MKGFFNLRLCGVLFLQEALNIRVAQRIILVTMHAVRMQNFDNLESTALCISIRENYIPQEQSHIAGCKVH